MPSAPKWINDALERIAPSMMRTVSVLATEYISPNIKKVLLDGSFSGLDLEPGYTISFRVNPTDSRHYTVSQADPRSGTIEFIAHLHGDAIGSNYVDALKTGDTGIKVALLGSGKQYSPKAENQIIFGDETSLSLVSSLMPFLESNSHQYRILLELDDCNRNIPEILGFKNCSVFIKHGIFRDIQQTREFWEPLCEEWSQANMILTGNITSLTNLRKVLREYSHTGKINVKGYWLEGKKGL